MKSNASIGLASSLGELLAALEARRITASALTEACLGRVASRELTLRAWAHIDPEHARRQARALDEGALLGPLRGIPIGVKDIFDTADMPTTYGSSIYRDHRPAADAACVALARAAGTVVLGKTASTEFACFSPTTTVNPRNTAHTPGGSSSGSAAAVADGMVPVALGTQTSGSIIRPASFCGIVGYKPSFGMLSRAGMKLLAESLDTIGVFARTVPDAAYFVGAMTARDDLRELPRAVAPMRIGVCRTHDWALVEDDAAQAFESAAQRLGKAGATMVAIDLPTEFAGLGDAHRQIFGYEATRSLMHERRAHSAELTAALRRELEAGDEVTAECYDAAQRLADECRRRLPDVTAGCDVWIAPSAIGEAPRGLDSTGNPVMNRIWTLLHGPCVNLPVGLGSNGLPLGLQVIGLRGRDAKTLAAAAWMRARLDT